MPDTNIPRHYRMQICLSMAEIGELNWNQLLQAAGVDQVFLSFGFLHSLELTACVGQNKDGHSGWQSCFMTLWEENKLVAAMPLYQKLHSYGEYVFDWSWAEAYQRRGGDYYPKLVSAIPFTPVSGPRLLAATPAAQAELVLQLRLFCTNLGFSSAHVLFPIEQEIPVLQQQGFQLRTAVQFHWDNPAYADFAEFLSTLTSKKRKNILAERRKVQQAGLSFRHLKGGEIQPQDWHFFFACYQRTYQEHHSHAYLNLDFFLQLAQQVPQNLLLILAYHDQQPVAAALNFYDDTCLYGRYWGCLDRYDSLHFETAYYQGQEFCIQQQIPKFEGGAQGAHKLARGFQAVTTHSCHYLHDTEFSKAVALFLAREQEHIKLSMQEFYLHSAYRSE